MIKSPKIKIFSFVRISILLLVMYSNILYIGPLMQVIYKVHLFIVTVMSLPKNYLFINYHEYLS